MEEVEKLLWIYLSTQTSGRDGSSPPFPDARLRRGAPSLGAPSSPQADGCAWLLGAGRSARHSDLGPRGVTASSAEVSSIHTGALQMLKCGMIETSLVSTRDSRPFSERARDYPGRQDPARQMQETTAGLESFP